jgi:hypothetical protein
MLNSKLDDEEGTRINWEVHHGGVPVGGGRVLPGGGGVFFGQS